MAFRKDKTGSAQTAANAAAVVVSAYTDSFGNFDEAVKAFHTLRGEIFSDLSLVVDADNKVFEEAEASSPAPKSSGSRERKTGGKSRAKNSSGSWFKGDLGDAKELKLKFGAFEGESLEAVLGFDADTCDEEYGYGDGNRDGRDYIKWLASDKNENIGLQVAARLIADEEGIDY
jgi:hypothetical protein